MKKGYHDYVPVVEPEVKETKKEVERTHEPRYIISAGGMRHMISDERGMVVAATDILMLGAKAPSINYVRPLNVDFKMSTKDYIKYNGKL